MFKWSVLTVLMSVSWFSLAQLAVVRGVIVSYDSKKVVLSQRDGLVHIEVPRKAVAKQFKKLQTGQRIHAFLDPLKVIETMKNRPEKPKQKEEKAVSKKRTIVQFE